MTKFERRILTISIFSFGIASFSMVFTFWQYQQSNRESIGITISQPEEDYPIKINDSTSMQTLPTYWKCVVTNNGDKKVSLTDYSIVEHVNTNTLVFGASYMHQGFYENFEKKIYLPIDIEDHSSRSFFIKIGLKTKIDKKYYKFETKNQLLSALLEDCKDIFGNEISIFFQDDFFYVNRKCDSSLSNPMSTDGPRFTIRFSSSRNSVFESKAYWYRPEGKRTLLKLPREVGI